MRKFLYDFAKLVLAVVCMATSVPPPASAREITTTQLLDSIAAAEGKVVLVNFFASFCPPCRKEVPGLIRIRSEFSPDKLEIIGVSVDRTPEDMAAFVSEYGFNYPVYFGGEELAFAFQVSSIPHNVIYDQQGHMVVNEAGYVPEEALAAFLKNMLGGEKS